jgi:hypothetical protein
LITYLIIINTYIAVILENFNQAHQQEEIGITEDDFDMFYTVWENYHVPMTILVRICDLFCENPILNRISNAIGLAGVQNLFALIK